MNLYIEKFQSVLEQAKSMRSQDESARDKIVRQTKMLIGKAFGTGHHYIHEVDTIRFTNAIAYPGIPDKHYRDIWETGRSKLINLIETVIADMEMGVMNSEAKAVPPADVTSKNVFVVHGHDDVMKVSVARTLERLGFDPIILHEQNDKGRTIIEKFTDYAGTVGAAIVLLSPDDRVQGGKGAMFRARQNVILELGYFLGKLGRDRVIALHRVETNFEMPTDFSGVLFTPYDEAWDYKVGRELKAMGYDVDLNKLT